VVQTSVHTTAAAAEDDDVIADHSEHLLLGSIGSMATRTKFVFYRYHHHHYHHYHLSGFCYWSTTHETNTLLESTEREFRQFIDE